MSLNNLPTFSPYPKYVELSLTVFASRWAAWLGMVIVGVCKNCIHFVSFASKVYFGHVEYFFLSNFLDVIYDRSAVKPGFIFFNFNFKIEVH